MNDLFGMAGVLARLLTLAGLLSVMGCSDRHGAQSTAPSEASSAPSPSASEPSEPASALSGTALASEAPVALSEEAQHQAVCKAAAEASPTAVREPTDVVALHGVLRCVEEYFEKHTDGAHAHAVDAIRVKALTAASEGLKGLLRTAAEPKDGADLAGMQSALLLRKRATELQKDNDRFVRRAMEFRTAMAAWSAFERLRGKGLSMGSALVGLKSANENRQRMGLWELSLFDRFADDAFIIVREIDSREPWFAPEGVGTVAVRYRMSVDEHAWLDPECLVRIEAPKGVQGSYPCETYVQGGAVTPLGEEIVAAVENELRAKAVAQ